MFAIVVLLLPGCGDNDCCKGVTADAAHDDARVDVIAFPDVPDQCAAGREKIKFPRVESCANDGGVEWCIPDTNNMQLLATLAAIDPTIHCAPGGGRAMCYTGGKLLCSYPTRYPDQCLSQWGEMKPEIWDNLCKVAAQPDVVEIVHTILE